MKQKGFIPILLLILIGALVIAVSAYYLGTQNGRGLSSNPVPNTTAPLTSFTTPSNTITNWKVYSDSTYSFKYPADWKTEAGTPTEREYWGGKDSVNIIAPSPTVSIHITPGITVYGFGGDIQEKKGETFNITIDGKKYILIEHTRIDNGLSKVYVSLQIPKSETQYYVLFGTGYPVNQDDNASVSDYMRYRQTILDILSTLKISKP